MSWMIPTLPTGTELDANWQICPVGHPRTVKLFKYAAPVSGAGRGGIHCSGAYNHQQVL